MPKAKYEIWKLQRPLSSTEPNPGVMAYTEGRGNLAIIPVPEETIKDIFGSELKIYVKAKVVNGILDVECLVPNQDW